MEKSLGDFFLLKMKASLSFFLMQRQSSIKRSRNKWLSASSSFPTSNALLIDFLLSSDAEILLIITN